MAEKRTIPSIDAIARSHELGDVMTEGPVTTQSEVEAMVRGYLGRLGRRYVPALVGLVAFALIMGLVPTLSPKQNLASGNYAGGGGVAAGGPAAGAGTGGVAGGPAASAGGAAATGGSGAGTGGGVSGSASGPVGSAGPVGPGGAETGAAGGGGLVGGAAITPPAPPGSNGVSRTGVACGGDARQVPWSKYAPVCEPAYHGNNGGSTSHGVTGDTITISYRTGSSAQDTALRAVTGAAAPGPDSEVIADMNTYIGLFNKTFELYGRHVVLKPFQGQGDYLAESSGTGLAQAQADAVTASQQGAFADGTFLFKPSPPYETYLAQQKVISLTPWGPPQSYFEQYRPFEYSWWPSGTKVGHYMANTACQRMNGLRAVFSGDALMQKQVRKFGLIAPENPQFQEIAGDIQATMQRCGAKIDKRIAYQINIPTYEQQSANMMAQMKAANVTTIICYCDPVIPIFLTQSATQDQYRPEWLVNYFGDAYGRLPDQTQWAHTIANGGDSIPMSQTEAYKAYKIANQSSEPAQQFFYIAYNTLLQLFDALQAAGPNLNPLTFERGVFSLPTSTGEWGTWSGGNSAYTPGANTKIGYWDPNATSNYDNKKGAWVSCEGGAFHRYDDANDYGPAHTQLHCFGK